MECSACILSPIVQALVAITKTYKNPIQQEIKSCNPNTPNKKTALYQKYFGDKNPYEPLYPSEINPLDEKLAQSVTKKRAKSEIIDPLVKSRADFRKIVALAHKLIDSPDGVHPSPIQSVCLGCSQTADDDNLSRSGQTFVSVDAMASSGLTASSSDPASGLSFDDESSDDIQTSDPSSSDPNAYEPTDDETDPDDLSLRASQSAHDYITSHAIPVERTTSSDSCSKLPSHIEDLLRKQLASFNALDDFEKILLLAIGSGMNFSSFGTMKWIPEEMKHPQSKQLIGQRWDRLVAKFPLAAVFQKSTPCKNFSSALSKHYSEENSYQGLLDLQDVCWTDDDSDSQSDKKKKQSSPEFSPIFSS